VSLKLDLVQTHDLKSMGHVFCEDCATELSIVLSDFRRYKNPRYSIDWEAPWHEFHNVIFIYPHLVQRLWDKDFNSFCPSCGNNESNRLNPLSDSLFDLRLIKRSLEEQHTHVCIACEGLFVEECMYKTRHGYICDDCIAFAEI
jgi:hypothetical protein